MKYCKVPKTEFHNLQTCYSFAYPIGEWFYIQPFSDVEVKTGWVEITEQDFETNKPIIETPRTQEQSRIDQLEDENALIALELAETQLRLDAVEQENADLIFMLVEQGVI